MAEHKTRFPGAMKAVKIKSNYLFYHIYIIFYSWRGSCVRVCPLFVYLSCYELHFSVSSVAFLHSNVVVFV